MKVLIEVTHPAHVHFFRNAITKLKSHGHTVAVTAREKDVTIDLLDNYQIPFERLSKIGNSKLSLATELITRDIRLWNFCRKFKPDVLTGISGVFAAHVGFLLRKPVVVWDDTEIASLAHKIAYPFVKAVYCPDCYYKKLGKKQHFYAGCHELAYLRPEYFKPDIEIVKSFGINPDEQYCLVRFVSWQAHHDVGQKGIEVHDKQQFIRDLSKNAKVYITSEKQLPESLEQYRLNIPPHLIHHVMAYASLYVGEGATMASESAVLGVPAVYINTLKLGYINMLEEYGLIRQTTDTRQALRMSIEFLTEKDNMDKYRHIHQQLLSDKINVTDYIVEMLEKYA